MYTGTHDNDTFTSMLKDKEYREKVKNYLKIDSDDNKDIIYESIKALAESKGNVLIVTPQDLLLQGNKYRFNTPGTLTNNWSYNASRGLYDEEIKQFLKELTIKTRRCN